MKKKTKLKIFLVYVGFIIGIIITVITLALTGHLK
jgi:hypothetical protein